MKQSARSTSLFLLMLLLLLASPSSRADSEPFPGIQQLMTAEEFKASGMEKLSPDELKSLNNWLIGYTAWEAPNQRRTSEEVQEAEKAFEIEANLRPPFTGWTGKTVFYLDNGQVWRQRHKGRFSYEGGDYAVIINKNFLGFHVMTHVATSKSIGVSRVE
jgi:hypothetical protein